MSDLVKIQTELKAPKNQRNSFGGYNYRSCEDILEAVKPILAKYDASLTVTDYIEQIGDRYYIKAEARLLLSNGDTWATQAYAREPLSKKGMDDAQITGTASSYARKYALNGLFLIDDNKDADTNEYQGKEAVNDLKKTQKIAAQKIDTVKMGAISTAAQNAGIPLEKILEKFGLQSIGDMTEEQFREASALIQKQKEIMEKKRANTGKH